MLDVDNFYLPTYTDLIGVNQQNFGVDVVKFSYSKVPLSREESAILNEETVIPTEPDIKIGELKSGNQSFIKLLFVPLVFQNGSYFKITNFSLTYTITNKPSIQSIENTTQNQVINGLWHKIGIVNRGMHKITYENLIAWKIINQPVKSNLIALLMSLADFSTRCSSLSSTERGYVLPATTTFKDNFAILYFFNCPIQYSISFTNSSICSSEIFVSDD